jgi:hypothetical protein
MLAACRGDMIRTISLVPLTDETLAMMRLTACRAAPPLRNFNVRRKRGILSLRAGAAVSRPSDDTPLRTAAAIGRLPMTRINRRTLVQLTAATMLVAGTAKAQRPDPSLAQIKTTDLGRKTYMLEGQGGNVLVVIGDDGIIMVDAELAPLHDKLRTSLHCAGVLWTANPGHARHR